MLTLIIVKYASDIEIEWCYNENRMAIIAFITQSRQGASSIF